MLNTVERLSENYKYQEGLRAYVLPYLANSTPAKALVFKEKQVSHTIVSWFNDKVDVRTTD